jgi:hypothetical protein
VSSSPTAENFQVTPIATTDDGTSNIPQQFPSDGLKITLYKDDVNDEGNGWTTHNVYYGIINKSSLPLFLYGGGTVNTTLDVEYPLGTFGGYIPPKAKLVGIRASSVLVGDDNFHFSYRAPTSAKPIKYDLVFIAFTSPLHDAFDLIGNDNKFEEYKIKISLNPELDKLPPDIFIPAADSLPLEYTQSDGLVRIKINSVNRTDGSIQISILATNLSQIEDSKYYLPLMSALYDDGYMSDTEIQPFQVGMTLKEAQIVGPGQTVENLIRVKDATPETGYILIAKLQDKNPASEKIVTFRPDTTIP